MWVECKEQPTGYIATAYNIPCKHCPNLVLFIRLLAAKSNSKKTQVPAVLKMKTGRSAPFYPLYQLTCRTECQ